MQAAGGGVIDSAMQNFHHCLIEGPADSVQILPCSGESCYSVGNYTAGCESIGGFVSGALDSSNAQAVCTVPGGVTQVTPCPPNTTSCTESKDFAQQCEQTLGGFVDGYFGE